MALTTVIKTYEQANRDSGVILQKTVKLAQNDNELVAAETDKQIQILRFVLGTDTASLLTLKTGSDPIMVFNLQNNGRVSTNIANPERPLYCGNVGENMVINSVAAPTNAYCYIQYRVR